MPTNPMTAIWQRLDRNPPIFFDEQLEPALGPVRDRVFALGLFRADHPSGSATCPDCGNVGRVEWLDRARTGRRDAYIRCTACGPVQIAPERLRRWAIDVPTLLTAVRESGRICDTATEVLAGHVWHLGTATWAKRRRDAYFLRCVHDGIRAGAASAIATHPKAVLFFPTEEAAHRWGAATDNPLVALESVARLESDEFVFDAAVVEARLVDAVPSAPEPRPQPKRAPRAANIAKLTEALVEFLRVARDHAHSTKRLTGTPKLLPRPTKTQLAKQVGLKKPAVTVCFKDESARELNYCWRLALDLDRVMDFRGSVPNTPAE